MLCPARGKFISGRRSASRACPDSVITDTSSKNKTKYLLIILYTLQGVNNDAKIIIFSICNAQLYPLLKRHFYRITEGLSYLFANVFTDSDDVARRSHLHDLAVVRHAIEGDMNRKATFAEKRFDVEWHLDIGGVHIFVLEDYCVKFKHNYAAKIVFFFFLFP